MAPSSAPQQLLSPFSSRPPLSGHHETSASSGVWNNDTMRRCGKKTGRTLPRIVTTVTSIMNKLTGVHTHTMHSSERHRTPDPHRKGSTPPTPIKRIVGAIGTSALSRGGSRQQDVGGGDRGTMSPASQMMPLAGGTDMTAEVVANMTPPPFRKLRARETMCVVHRVQSEYSMCREGHWI